MSSLPSFFQTSKPKGFHFIPRYYDPEKEALQQRIAMIEQELGLTSREGEYVPRIQRGTMTTYFRRKLRKRERSSNLMLLVILALLLWLAWFLCF